MNRCLQRVLKPSFVQTLRFSVLKSSFSTLSIASSKWGSHSSTSFNKKLVKVGSLAACVGCGAYCSTIAGAQAKQQMGSITLYQYEACPFCSKVRAFLDYNKVPYNVVEVNPMKKKELEFSKDYKKVPVLTMDGEVMTDSKDIVNFLSEKLGKEQTSEELEWRTWVDENVMKLLSPNIYRTPSEALQAFEYLNAISNFTASEKIINRYFGALVMYLVAKKNKKKKKIDDPRVELYGVVDHWMTEAVKGKDFAGGSTPNAADLDMFGVMRAMSMMECTWKDVTTNSTILPWFQRMEKVIGESSRLTKSL